jgi:hypothetical protein
MKENKVENKTKKIFMSVIRYLDELNEKYSYLQPFNSEYFWWMNLYLLIAYGLSFFGIGLVVYYEFFR